MAMKKERTFEELMGIATGKTQGFTGKQRLAAQKMLKVKYKGVPVAAGTSRDLTHGLEVYPERPLKPAPVGTVKLTAAPTPIKELAPPSAEVRVRAAGLREKGTPPIYYDPTPPGASPGARRWVEGGISWEGPGPPPSTPEYTYEEGPGGIWKPVPTGLRAAGPVELIRAAEAPPVKPPTPRGPVEKEMLRLKQSGLMEAAKRHQSGEISFAEWVKAVERIHSPEIEEAGKKYQAGEISFVDWAKTVKRLARGEPARTTAAPPAPSPTTQRRKPQGIRGFTPEEASRIAAPGYPGGPVRRLGARPSVPATAVLKRKAAAAPTTVSQDPITGRLTWATPRSVSTGMGILSGETYEQWLARLGRVDNAYSRTSYSTEKYAWGQMSEAEAAEYERRTGKGTAIAARKRGMVQPAPSGVLGGGMEGTGERRKFGRRLPIDPRLIERIMKSPRMKGEQKATFLQGFGGPEGYLKYQRLPYNEKLTYLAILEGYGAPEEIEPVTGLSVGQIEAILGKLRKKGLIQEV